MNKTIINTHPGVRQFPDSCELRLLFVGQALLLAERVKRGYGIDFLSLKSLVRLALVLVIAEAER